MSNLLIHIGYPKAASSWLQKFLFPSRELGFARPMVAAPINNRIVAPHDLGFDADATRAWFLPKLEAARADGLVPVLSAERLCGDLKQRLHDSVRNADRLAAVFPRERVLMVVREQRSMILSAWRQYVANGGLLSLNAYVAGADWWWYVPFELPELAFDRLVAHYHSRFGAENVLVLPYELFRRDGREFVSRVIEFAGARADPHALDTLPFGTFANPATPPVTVALRRRANRFVRGFMQPWARFRHRSLGGRFLLSVSYRAGRIAPAALNRQLEQRMRETVATAVGDYYRESNARLSELIGMDLAEHGYDVAPIREPRLLAKR